MTARLCNAAAAALEARQLLDRLLHDSYALKLFLVGYYSLTSYVSM